MDATYAYVITYELVKGVLSQRDEPEETLRNLLSSRFLIRVRKNYNYYNIDLNKLYMYRPNLNLEMSVSQFAETYLTDLICETYHYTIPTKVDDAYPNRLKTYTVLSDLNKTIAFTSRTQHSVRNDRRYISVHNDLVITDKNKENMKNMLVNVNGTFHRSIVFEDELYVIDGFKNIRNNKNRIIGAVDTTSVGGHQLTSIGYDNLVENDDPWRGIYIRFPGIDFTNKTVLLVIYGNMFVLDGTYQVVNRNTLKLNIPRMDLINNWLHNPNTLYKLGYTSIFDEGYSEIDGVVYRRPTIKEKIVQYINFEFDRLKVRKNTDLAALQQMDYNSYYSDVSDITKIIPTEDLKDPNFLYKLLTSDHSFVVTINNKKLFRRNYPLDKIYSPHQYESRSLDTPRGLFRYNHNLIFPFFIYTNKDDAQHNITNGFQKIHTDVYKTINEPAVIPAPVFDVKDYDLDYPAELIELYSV